MFTVNIVYNLMGLKLTVENNTWIMKVMSE